MLLRGFLNSILFIIFSVVLYFFSQNGKKWIFSSLSDLNSIINILSKTLYILSFGIQKLCLLSILYNENPILASFSSLIYYFEPFMSMIIMKVLYNKNIEKGQLEIIFEMISGIFFLFTFITSIEIIILPCDCLKKDTRSFISQRAVPDKNNNDNDPDPDNQQEIEDGKELDQL